MTRTIIFTKLSLDECNNHGDVLEKMLARPTAMRHKLIDVTPTSAVYKFYNFVVYVL